MSETNSNETPEIPEIEIEVPEKYAKERDELKKKYPVVGTLKIPKNDKNTEHVIYFLKKIDRSTYSAVNKLLVKDELLATQALINNLWIGGDSKDILKDPENWDILHSASFVCGEYLLPRKAELKKN